MMLKSLNKENSPLQKQGSMSPQLKKLANNLDKFKCCDHKKVMKMSEILENMTNKMKDPWYREADGVYIVMQGSVDVVDSEKKKCHHTIGLNEHFGVSKILKSLHFEHLGDLFAGFRRLKKKQG